VAGEPARREDPVADAPDNRVRVGVMS
jgi:hypothetical protein